MTMNGGIPAGMSESSGARSAITCCHPRESGNPVRLGPRFRGDDGRVRTFATWYQALSSPPAVADPPGMKRRAAGPARTDLGLIPF